MKTVAIITLVLVIAMLGYWFFHSQTYHPSANVPPPTNSTPVSFTDSNGNEFTVYVGGAIVNGTNVTITNHDFNIGPAHSVIDVSLQTNTVSK